MTRFNRAVDVDAGARSLGITVDGVGAAMFRLRAKFREALRNLRKKAG